MIKRFNITSCKTYQKDGDEKKTWPQVGTMVYFPATDEWPEKYQIELNMFPNHAFYVFEQKDRQTGPNAEPAIDAETRAPLAPAGKPEAIQRPRKVMASASDEGIAYPQDDINPDDIPF